jgi:3'-phosphoadenosine 5'-phosphosulfate sulfotransferase (PAPS reductase)/FAD synthetase
MEYPYITWSAGKDSTALVYLITQEMGHKDMLIFCQKDDCDYPGEKEYVLELIQKYSLNVEIVEPEESMWEYVCSNDIDLRYNIHAKSNIITKKFFLSCINRFMGAHPEIDGYFMGLRADESKSRSINYAKRGMLYYKKTDNKIVCNPLSLWTVYDVFAYLVGNNVPILDVYLKTSCYQTAEKIRKAWWLPDIANKITEGGMLDLKVNYPELYFKLIRNKPELEHYS